MRQSSKSWIPSSVRHHPIGVAGPLGLAVMVGLAIVAPIVWGADASKLDVVNATQGPSADHLLGTDRLGRDILARTLAATRLSLVLGLSAALVAAVVGFPIGSMVALMGPRARAVAFRLIEASLVLSGILTALVVSAILGPSPQSAILAIGLSFAPEFARLASTLALSIVSRDFVAAGQVIGLSRRRILFRYILPNIAEPLVISASYAAGVSVVLIASLSFLGLGVQPPDFDWGRMLTEGVQAIYVTPAAALAPATAIALAGMVIAFAGDGIARALNPRSSSAAPHDASRPARSPVSLVPTPPVRETTGTQPSPLLVVEGLAVTFQTSRGELLAVNDVSFVLDRGEIIGIVGESGSGKSMTALAIAGLVGAAGVVRARRLELDNEDLLFGPHRRLELILGRRLAMVFQDPLTSLNPALRVGEQVAEPAVVHRGVRGREARDLAVARLRDVHIAAPEARIKQYPHEFSGGMRQRAMIAMGLVNDPLMIIADEPTTSLDVTIQAQVLDLFREINRTRGMAIMLISHDIGVITEICTRVLVMYAGSIVEDITTDELVAGRAAHPYTRALLGAEPGLFGQRGRPLAAIPGRTPDLDLLSPGCPFAPRCSEVIDRCRWERPMLEDVGVRHTTACFVAVDRAVRAAGPPRSSQPDGATGPHP